MTKRTPLVVDGNVIPNVRVRETGDGLRFDAVIRLDDGRQTTRTLGASTVEEARGAERARPRPRDTWARRRDPHRRPRRARERAPGRAPRARRARTRPSRCRSRSSRDHDPHDDRPGDDDAASLEFALEPPWPHVPTSEAAWPSQLDADPPEPLVAPGELLPGFEAFGPVGGPARAPDDLPPPARARPVDPEHRKAIRDAFLRARR